MRTANFSVALCKGTVHRNVFGFPAGGTNFRYSIIKKEKQESLSCVCSESDGWCGDGISFASGRAKQGGTRERAVPTKSWNVRPE